MTGTGILRLGHRPAHLAVATGTSTPAEGTACTPAEDTTCAAHPNQVP